MKDDEPTRYDRIIRWFKNHWFWGPAMLLGGLLLLLLPVYQFIVVKVENQGPIYIMVSPPPDYERKANDKVKNASEEEPRSAPVTPRPAPPPATLPVEQAKPRATPYPTAILAPKPTPPPEPPSEPKSFNMKLVLRGDKVTSCVVYPFKRQSTGEIYFRVKENGRVDLGTFRSIAVWNSVYAVHHVSGDETGSQFVSRRLVFKNGGLAENTGSDPQPKNSLQYYDWVGKSHLLYMKDVNVE